MDGPKLLIVVSPWLNTRQTDFWNQDENRLLKTPWSCEKVYVDREVISVSTNLDTCYTMSNFLIELNGVYCTIKKTCTKGQYRFKQNLNPFPQNGKIHYLHIQILQNVQPHGIPWSDFGLKGDDVKHDHHHPKPTLLKFQRVLDRVPIQTTLFTRFLDSYCSWFSPHMTKFTVTLLKLGIAISNSRFSFN